MWSVCLFSVVFVYTLVFLSNGQSPSRLSFGNWESLPGRNTRRNFVRSNPNQLSRNRLSFNRNSYPNNNQVYINNNRYSRNNQVSWNNQFPRNTKFSVNNRFSRQNQFPGNNQFSMNNNINSFSNRPSTSRHNPFTPSTMNLLLKFINLHRQSVDAQNMYVMKWSNTLAIQAGERSQTCQLLHMNSTSGESLIVVPQQFTRDKVAEYINKHWIAEKNNFRLGTDCRVTTPNSCAYSQMIWAQSKTMGCASHWCASSQLVVCLFDPPGNVMAMSPYIKGNHCERCPRDTVGCQDQLCVW